MSRSCALVVGTVTAAVVGVACSSFGAGGGPAEGDEAGAARDGDVADDDGARGDANAAGGSRCDRSKPFGTPQPVLGLTTDFTEGGASLSRDGLALLFHTNVTTGNEANRIHVAGRAGEGAPFGAAQPLVGNFGDLSMNDPHLVSSGRLFFTAGRNGDAFQVESAILKGDLTLEARASIPSLASSSATIQPYATDGRLYVASERARNAFHIFAATITAAGEIETPQLVDELVGPGAEWRPVVTPDDLTIYFARSPTADIAGMDIFVARRTTPTEKFGAPELVAELSEPGVFDNPTWVSADECRIYFESVRRQGGGGDVWVAERPR